LLSAGVHGELLDGRPDTRMLAVARGTTGVTGGNPRRRILLVEDDEDTRQLLAVALEAQSYAVSQAGDAEEGLDALGRGRFDLILTDYDLPGKTGAAMLREANARHLVDGAATLVVTAHPDPEGVEETTLVRKPLDLEKFLLKIRGIFDSRSGRPLPVPVPVPATASASARAAEAGDVELTLYISPTSPPSMKARRNVERMIADFPAARIRFEVLDLAREPERAESDNVVFTPTLVKRLPEPRAWFLGDLSDRRVVADLLHMCGIEPVAGP
jgi:CheY-like chemotaxis protein